MKWWIALAAGFVAIPLGAQSVRGRLLEAERHTPLVGGLVELRDSTGVPLMRMLTTASGAFAFVLPHPGRYGVRAAAIGFIPSPVRIVLVPAGGVNLDDFILMRSAIKLPDLVTASSARACGLQQLRGTFSDVLESARTALQVVAASFDAGNLGFRVRVIQASTLAGVNGGSIADTTESRLTSWPVRSAPPDSLQRFGFAREAVDPEPAGIVYYGPDATVLFADWFLESHCFSLVVDKRNVATDSVRMRFEPRGKPDLVDLTGELVFDRETMSLRRLDFRHVHTPAGIPEGSAGGSITFDRWPSGLWLPVAWRIYGPIESIRYTGPPPLRGAPPSTRLVMHRTVAGKASLEGKVMEVIRP